MTRRIRPVAGELLDLGLQRMAPGGSLWSESPVYTLREVVAGGDPAADEALPPSWQYYMRIGNNIGDRLNFGRYYAIGDITASNNWRGPAYVTLVVPASPPAGSITLEMYQTDSGPMPQPMPSPVQSWTWPGPHTAGNTLTTPSFTYIGVSEATGTEYISFYVVAGGAWTTAWYASTPRTPYSLFPNDPPSGYLTPII